MAAACTHAGRRAPDSSRGATGPGALRETEQRTSCCTKFCECHELPSHGLDWRECSALVFLDWRFQNAKLPAFRV